MFEVEILLDNFTKLYVTDEVYNFICGFEKKSENGKPINQVLKKLEYLSKRGFHLPHESRKHEGDQIYRFRINQCRFIGFFADKDFIAIKCFKKKSDKLSNPQKLAIAQVKKIKEDVLWRIR